jgi:hypothetical protein
VALFAELVKDGYNERAYLAEQASISCDIRVVQVRY